jgi:hypothetical protein
LNVYCVDYQYYLSLNTHPVKQKIIPINTAQSRERLDVATCRKVLNQNGNDYPDEEIIMIRDYLYQLAEIECRHFKDWQEREKVKVININHTDYETTESYPLYQGKYRRTG